MFSSQLPFLLEPNTRVTEEDGLFSNHFSNRMEIKITGHSLNRSRHKIKRSVTCYSVDKSNRIKRFKKEDLF